MSPRFVNREQKIKEIAIASLNLFARQGYAATSVGQIAREAQIGKGTIYEYFLTKEDIFVAAVLEYADSMEARVAEQLEGMDDPIESIYGIVRVYTELADPKEPKTARFFFEILQQALMGEGPFYKRRNLAREMTDGIRRIIMEVLLDGVSKSIFRPEIARDAEKIAVNLLAYLSAIGWHCMIMHIDAEEHINFHIQQLLDTLVKEPTASETASTAASGPYNAM
jgi:AcrR family transcriptional regulator